MIFLVCNLRNSQTLWNILDKDWAFIMEKTLKGIESG